MAPAKSLLAKKHLKPLRGYPLPASCSVSSLDEFLTDGNASFLRAARSGNVEKIIEHLKGNIDINTSNANGLNALHLAAKEGHVHIVTELLKRGANVNAATKKGNTALHIASLAGQEEVARMLVQLGANVNIQSQNGFTPLYMAAQENHDSVVSFLLANGANQSLATEDGFTPLAVALQQGHDKVVAVLLENDTKGRVRLPALHIAAKKDDCKAATLLLQSDHNPDVTSKSGFTPLHIAAHYGNENIAKILLSKGADVNYAAKHQITPLHVASKWGKMNMVLLLLEKGGNIEASTRDGLTPLHCAARSGHDQVVDVLLEKGAPFLAKTKNGLAPLHMASQGDHVDSARILLYHKAPVDDVTVDYLTALHVAAHCGHVKVAKLLLDRKADPNARALNGFTPLHIACKKNRIKVVELLLKHGASIEATTESGLTPLHVASFMGCMNIVIYLIQNGANPDVPTVRGETPLHLAARANQTDIIRILLRNGASVDARAREEQTPLHIAARLGNVDIVSLLLQHGAAVDATTKDMYTALHISAKEDQEEVASSLLDHGAALAATTKKGFTPLHLAAKYGNIKVARLLIQKSAAVDAQGKNGVTPLHVAAHYDHVNVALLLLDKGASPHAMAKNGYTPLHIAAKKNQMDIASTLLEYGAKTNSESKAGFTPLHLSSQEGHVDMSSLLIENKADVNHKANNGLTPLHLCAQDDRVDVAHILVGHKAEIGPQTKAGYTPLHVASHFGQINMVRFLLHHGADVHMTTSHGYTSLHQAAQQGHTLAVNLLLENQASPNVTTMQGQTPLSIAQRLGYISVVETLKVVTETTVTTTTTTVTEEKYKVVAPETMQETFMTDSEDEGGADFDEAAIFGKPTHATHVYLPYVEGHNFLMSEEAMLGDQSYGYLTADEMKSLGDDSLPIDVTKDEKHHDILHSVKQFGAPMVEEDKLSPQHGTPVEGGFSEKFSPDNIDLERAPMHVGFLVSFMVDARGGAMRGCRHSGVRVIIPPRKASMPMRITCRYLRKEKLIHPPPLMEGEACASRILEMGPVGARFLGPVIIEVPHFASTRGKEREITILRSDTGETWKEHTLEASEEAVQEVLNESFEGEELNALEDLNTNRITRILTTDFPQYFAIVSRVRQEVHGVGPEGGMVSSTVVPQVQAIFPEGALTKKIRVGLQAQPIAPELVAKLLGNRVAVSPIVTVEPRRRKFHKPITLTIPVPQATTKGMINQYSGDAPTLRLLCSITGGSSKAQWEDVTGSTPLTFVNDCVSFTTTVSARFWLMDCRQVNEVTRFATELYQEAVYVPFMSKFVIFAKRYDSYEAQLRVFCMTDDKEDKTLECQEHFTEVAKSRDVEVLEGKLQYLEFAGNIAPVTKSGEQLKLAFQAFHENRLPFTIRVKDPHIEPMGRIAFMREPKTGRGEPPQVPICNLNVALPEITLTEASSADVLELVKLEKRYDFIQEAGLSKPELIHRADLRLSDIAQGLDKDWVLLAQQLDVSENDISQIKADATCDQPEQALMMLRLWLQKSGSKATGNELEKGLRKINREDIIKNCMFNVELVTDDVEKAVAKVHLDQSGFDVFKEELGSSREASMRRGASLDISYDEQDIMKEAESAAETSSETGSLFERDQISQALTDDKEIVYQKDESSKLDADDDDNAAVLFPKCKKPSSKHTENTSTPKSVENLSFQNESVGDSQSKTEDITTNNTQKHFVRTHDFWPPDKLVEIHSSESSNSQIESAINSPLPSSDTLIQTKNINPIDCDDQIAISPQEVIDDQIAILPQVLLSDSTSDFDKKSIDYRIDTKAELNIDLLQKCDTDKSIDPSDLGYCSMDKDSNMSPNSTSESIKYVNLSQLPDVVSHDCTSPSQNITTPFPTHSVQIEELKYIGSMQSSEMEQSPVQGSATLSEESNVDDYLSGDLRNTASLEVDQNCHENSESCDVYTADAGNVIQQAASEIISRNNFKDEISNFEDARIRRASKTPPPSPVDKPDRGGENLNKGVEILLSHSSLEDKLKEPVDLAHKSQEVLGREELQVRLTESETWPSLELDTSQVSISSLPDDEKSEPTTATASDAAVVVDTADKDITFVERIEKSEFEGPGLATHIIQKTTHMTMYSSSDAPCTEEGGLPSAAASLDSEKEKTSSPDSPELSFAEKRDFFQKLSETSSSNVTPTHTLKSTSDADGRTETLVSEELGSAESPDEQLSFKECLKFFEKSGDSPPSPKLEIKDIKKEVWTVVGDDGDSENLRLDSVSDVSDIERERDIEVVEVQEKRRSTVSIDEQVSLPLYESKEVFDTVFDSTKDAKVEVVVKTFHPGSEMLEICSVENIPHSGDETHVKSVRQEGVTTQSITLRGIVDTESMDTSERYPDIPEDVIEVVSVQEKEVIPELFSKCKGLIDDNSKSIVQEHAIAETQVKSSKKEEVFRSLATHEVSKDIGEITPSVKDTDISDTEIQTKTIKAEESNIQSVSKEDVLYNVESKGIVEKHVEEIDSESVIEDSIFQTCKKREITDEDSIFITERYIEIPRDESHVESTERTDSKSVSSGEVATDVPSKSKYADKVEYGSDKDKKEGSSTPDDTTGLVQEDVMSNEEFISKTFKTMTESSYEVSKSTVGAFKNNVVDKLDNKWQRESPDNISIVKDTMEPSLGKSEIFICTEETLDNVKKILSVADAESNVVINENASSSTAGQDKSMEVVVVKETSDSIDKVNRVVKNIETEAIAQDVGGSNDSQIILEDKLEHEKVTKGVNQQYMVKDKPETKADEKSLFICTEETASISKKIISEIDKETEQFLSGGAIKMIETKKEDAVDHGISTEDSSKFENADDKDAYVVETKIKQVIQIHPESSRKEDDLNILVSESKSSSLELLEISKDDSKEENYISASEALSSESKYTTKIQEIITTETSQSGIIESSDKSELSLKESVEGTSRTQVTLETKDIEESLEFATAAKFESKPSKEENASEEVLKVSSEKIYEEEPMEANLEYKTVGSSGIKTVEKETERIVDTVTDVKLVEKDLKLKTTAGESSKTLLKEDEVKGTFEVKTIELIERKEKEESTEKGFEKKTSHKDLDGKTSDINTTNSQITESDLDEKNAEKGLDKVSKEKFMDEETAEESFHEKTAKVSFEEKGSEKELNSDGITKHSEERATSDIEALKTKIQSERDVGLQFEESFTRSVGSNEEKSESCFSSLKDQSVEIEFLPNLEVTGDVSEAGVDRTGHDASGTPCSFHKEMDFDDKHSDLGDSFEEIERNKIINEFKLENKSPSVEKAEFEAVEKKEQTSSEEIMHKESVSLHRAGKETVHSVEVTQFKENSREVYNVPSEKLIEKFSSKRIHIESSSDGKDKSQAPHRMNQFLESMIDQGASIALPSDVTPVHKRTEEWIDQSEAIMLREGPMIESAEIGLFEDRPPTLEDEPHKRSSPTAESFDDKARVEQCDTDVMMQLMDFVSRNDIELAEVRTEDEAPDIEEDVSPTAEEEICSRISFEDSKAEERTSKKEGKDKPQECLKVIESENLQLSPQRSSFDSVTSPSRKDVGSDTVETVVEGRYRDGSSSRMHPQSSLEVEVGSHDSEEAGIRDPDREMTPLSFVEEESLNKADFSIGKKSQVNEAHEYKNIQEAEIPDKETASEIGSPAVVFELVSAKKRTEPSGLGHPLETQTEAEVVDETADEEQVVQDNLVEYIAGLSGEGNLQQQTLASEQSVFQIQNLESLRHPEDEDVQASTIGKAELGQESDSHGMGSTTYIKTTVSNIVPESSEQFVVRTTTTSTTVTSADGTVKTNGSAEQKPSSVVD